MVVAIKFVNQAGFTKNTFAVSAVLSNALKIFEDKHEPLRVLEINLIPETE